MIDCGATGEFIDGDYAVELNLPTTRLERAIPVFNVDGTRNQLGSITEQCEVIMRYQDHYESIKLFITKLGKRKLIIGHPWLKKHNPEIDWRTGVIKMTRCPDECARKYPEVEEENKSGGIVCGLGFDDEVTDFKIYNVELGIWDTVDSIPKFYINAYTSKSIEIAAENYVDKTFEEAVPTKYHKYKKVFEEIPPDYIPPRRSWDHAIDLKPNVEPSKLTKAYPISPTEQIAVDKFIDENLKTGRIRPSKSP